MSLQIDQLPATEFNVNFADEECEWWPPAAGDQIKTKLCRSNGWTVDIRLISVDGAPHLFIKYFTF